MCSFFSLLLHAAVEGAQEEVVPEVVPRAVEEGEVVVVEEVEVGVAGEEVVEVDFRKSTGAVIHIHTRRIFANSDKVQILNRK